MWIMWQLDHAVPCLVRIVAGNETKAFEPQSFDIRCGYGSIPIDTFLVGWTSIYQLFWGSLGTRVLTHPHVSIWLNLSTCRHPCSSLHIFWHLVRCADHWEAAILVSRNLVIAFSMTLDIWYICDIYIYSIYYIYYIYVIYIVIYIYIYIYISDDIWRFRSGDSVGKGMVSGCCRPHLRWGLAVTAWQSTLQKLVQLAGFLEMIGTFGTRKWDGFTWFHIFDYIILVTWCYMMLHANTFTS